LEWVLGLDFVKGLSFGEREDLGSERAKILGLGLDFEDRRKGLVWVYF